MTEQENLEIEAAINSLKEEKPLSENELSKVYDSLRYSERDIEGLQGEIANKLVEIATDEGTLAADIEKLRLLNSQPDLDENAINDTTEMYSINAVILKDSREALEELNNRLETNRNEYESVKSKVDDLLNRNRANGEQLEVPNGSANELLSGLRVPINQNIRATSAESARKISTGAVATRSTASSSRIAQ